MNGTSAGDANAHSSSAIPVHSISDQHSHQQQAQPETRMAVAELLVSLGQQNVNEEHSQGYSDSAMAPGAQPPQLQTPGSEQESPMYRNAVDYVGSVKKAYLSNPRVYTEFLEALEKYHNSSLPLEQLVPTVMSLFQDQPDLLMGFKDFLPEAQNLMNRLVPPMMYSDYKPPHSPLATPPSFHAENGVNQILENNGHAAADFLSLIKERSSQEPDMYQHMISLLRKFQKDHSYSTLYFYISIILRYHPHLLQRFHKFLPTVTTGVEVTEPRIISKAPPEELVVSADFIEAKDFVQTVKYQAKSDMSMYDRFIFALEKYQRTGWTIDQVYSEVSLIFWNHPDALAGFKQFISTVPQQP
ncbi:Transcriptional regulatory protein sin3 [Podila verticillata]|nr:Transcriptional regulatory protein sin3 [Podila verticillata]